MRVLFLDFDGVLHPLGLEPVPGAAPVNGKPRARAVPVDLFCWVPLLADLLAPYPDVHLVVHSTWRESHAPACLGPLLGPLQSRYLGATAAGAKRASIAAWLDAHPQVRSYRVLDDMALDAGPAWPQFVRCHYRTGLGCPQVQAHLRSWLAAP